MPEWSVVTRLPGPEFYQPVVVKYKSGNSGYKVSYAMNIPGKWIRLDDLLGITGERIYPDYWRPMDQGNLRIKPKISGPVMHIVEVLKNSWFLNDSKILNRIERLQRKITRLQQKRNKLAEEYTKNLDAWCEYWREL